MQKEDCRYSDGACCRDTLDKAKQLDPGIRNVLPDPEKTGTLAIDFDPKKTSTQDLHKSLQTLDPEFRERLRKCAYRLQGRGCEARAKKLEERLAQQEGIVRATASFIGSSLCVTYDQRFFDESSKLGSVLVSGSKAVPLEEALRKDRKDENLRQGSFKERIKFWFSGDRIELVFVVFALLGLLGGWVNQILGGGPWLSFLGYGLSYLFGGYFGLLSAYESLKDKTLDIDLLMILAAVGAATIGAPMEGAMLLFLFALSNVMQAFAIGKTRKAIESLSSIRPKSARVLSEDEQTVDTLIGDIEPGQMILIKPGERVPLDAEVIRGESSVDQSSITGESIPVDKTPGDGLFSGTINQKGSLVARVTKAESDSTLSQLIELVEEAQSEKAKSQRFLEDAEQGYALGVMLLTGALMLALPLVFGLSWGDGFYRAITVMVVASPCALVISTPASVLSAIGNGARRGILFKGGVQLERAATISSIAFDKTGTLTCGKPEVVAIEWMIEHPEKYLEAIVAIENHSEHPLAKAVVEHGVSQNLPVGEPEQFDSETGVGVSGIYQRKRLRIGKPEILIPLLENASAIDTQITTFQQAGETVVIVGEYLDQALKPVAIIRIADKVRENAAEVVQSLRKLGVHKMMMLTGDSLSVADSIAQKVGIDLVHANLLPAQKVELMKNLANGEPVAMVGDGVNDAPALAGASVGIAMGAAGSDVALESADIVLLSDDLKNVAHVVRLSRKTRAIILQNLVFAGGIIISMVLATLLLPIWNMEIPLPIGVVAHEGGTVLVCLNGLRLLFVK